MESRVTIPLSLPPAERSLQRSDLAGGGDFDVPLGELQLSRLSRRTAQYGLYDALPRRGFMFFQQRLDVYRSVTTGYCHPTSVTPCS